MQDQGKRLMIAVALALGVMLLWSKLAPKDEPPPGDKAASGSAAGASGATSGAALPPALQIGGVSSDDPPPVAMPRPEVKPDVLSFDNVVVTFSSRCGGLVGWQLTDPRYQRDATRGQLLPDRALMKQTDAKGTSTPVPAEQLASLPDCGAFDVNFLGGPGASFVIPRDAVWRAEPSATELRYTYASDQLEVVKTFTVLPAKYLVRMTVKVTARVAEAHPQLVVSAYEFQDPADVKQGRGGVAPRVWSSSSMRDGSVVQTEVDKVLEWPRYERSVQWAGYEHPFLLVGYAPREGDQVEMHTRAADGTHGQPRGFMRKHMVYPLVTLRAGESFTKEIVGYLGPKNYDDLHDADLAAGFTTGFNHVIDLGWFSFIGRPLLWLLQRFHAALGNWGLAIILLTILVKLATLYWTTKSMRSMKAMAALGPQMKALQTKYAEDKQRQQAETMALYKEHGVNPVAGCLPIFLQMPIWLALYRMLSNVGELYQQPFIPGWINDLTASDPTYVLPVVLMVTMFAQARLQPASVDSTQQKFLQYGMPLMFGVMSFFFASGLSLYILTNTLLSAAHSIYMNKFDKQSLALAAQLKKNQEAAAAVAAGKSPTGGAGKPGAKSAAAAKRVVVDTTGGVVSRPSGGAAGVATPRLASLVDGKPSEVAQASDDAGDDAGEGSPTAGDASNADTARSRPRRKKRKR